jgi:hypothetical protein
VTPRRLLVVGAVREQERVRRALGAIPGYATSYATTAEEALELPPHDA